MSRASFCDSGKSDSAAPGGRSYVASTFTESGSRCDKMSQKTCTCVTRNFVGPEASGRRTVAYPSSL